MGQVCQKCGDGEVVCTKGKNINGPQKPHLRNKGKKNGGGQRGTGGGVSFPNSDMTFHNGNDAILGESADQGGHH